MKENIIKYNHKIIKTVLNHNQNAIAKAGNKARIGHKYGINSISHAIIASVKLFSKSIPKKLSIVNDIKTIKNIIIARKNCHLSQSYRLLTIFVSLDSKYFDNTEGIIS